MPQIFFDISDIKDGMYTISGSDFEHLARVRRVQIGQALELRSNNGILYNTVVEKIDQNAIVVSLVDKVAYPENQIVLRLYCAITKGKNFDLTLQKSTEVGVTDIIPIITQRTVPYINQKKENKFKRWNRIVFEAAKQSYREYIPVVHTIMSFDDIMKAPDDSVNIIAHPEASYDAKKFFESKNKITSTNVLIGPEGGFSQKEIDQAIEGGWSPVRFGHSILRAETAAIVIPAIILHEMQNYGDFNKGHL